MSERKGLKSLVHVWKIVAVYYLVFFLTVFIAYLWLGWQAAVLVAAVEMFFHISWWIELKSKILQGLPEEFRCLPTHIEEFSELDLNSLFAYTEELEALGFAKVVDYKLEVGGGLARVFAHPQYFCFAEVFQLFPVGQDPTPVFCTVHSALEKDWTISTTIVEPDGIKHMWRSPKTLWTYHPQATPAELLEIHLKRRQEMVETLQVKNLTDLSWEFYFSQQQKGSIQRRETFQKKNIVTALIEATLFELHPKSEWMGEYPKIAARRKQPT